MDIATQSEMILQIEALAQNLTPWELGFINNLKKTIKNKKRVLTDNQLNILSKLYKRITKK